MTIVEFLSPLQGKPIKEFCLAVLYFSQRYNQKDALTVEEIRQLLKRARIPRASRLNIASFLSKSGQFVDTPGKKGKKFLWSLTTRGEQHVRSQLRLPEADMEIEHDVSNLETMVRGISNHDVTDYIQEAVKCLSIGALRAAVVFLWAGTIRDIQEKAFLFGETKLNSAIQRHDAKVRQIKKIEDFSYIKESILLLASQDLGMFDKNEREILEEALKLRNKCSHPGKYKAGPKKVSSFIEDIISIAFS